MNVSRYDDRHHFLRSTCYCGARSGSPQLTLRRMREGYGNRSVCVCVCVCLSVCLCVCYHANCYIPHFFVEIQVSLGFLCCFQRMHCVDFIENALLKSSGDICWSPLPSLLLDQLSEDKRDSDGFFSCRLVCRTSDSSYNSTDSSLVTDYKQTFMACDCSKTADKAYRHTYMIRQHIMSSCAIAQLIMCIFLWLLQMSNARLLAVCITV